LFKTTEMSLINYASEKAEGVQVEGAPSTNETNTATDGTTVANENNSNQSAEENKGAEAKANSVAETTTASKEPSATAGATTTEIANTTTNNSTATEQATVDAETVKKAAIDDLLKKFNLQTVEELEQKLNPPAQLTPEQQKRNEDVFKASVQEFAVRNLDMTPEEFVEMENVKGLTDQELVFREFKRNWIAENKDNPDFKDKDLDAEAKYEFDEMFHINSENSRVKDQAQKIIEKTAANLRGDYEDKWNDVKTQYEKKQTFVNNVSQFKAVIKNDVLKSLPKEMTFDIDGENKVVYSLDKVDLKEVESYLVNDQNLDFFVQKGGPEASKRMNDLVKNFIRLKYHEDIVNTAIKTAMDIGTKKGGVGAKAPFVDPALITNTTVSETELTPADMAKIKKAFPGGRNY